MGNCELANYSIDSSLLEDGRVFVKDDRIIANLFDKPAPTQLITRHCSLFTFFFDTMAVKVLIPTPLQKFTNDQATLECTGSNISELIDALEQNCPGIKARLCDESGEPRRFLNFYVNSEDIRFLEGTSTSLNDGDEVSIVPAVAGG